MFESFNTGHHLLISLITETGSKDTRLPVNVINMTLLRDILFKGSPQFFYYICIQNYDFYFLFAMIRTQGLISMKLTNF